MAVRILVLCTGNSCRSQMAEGIGQALGAKRFVFSSGGIVPQPVDQETARFLADKGIDISRHVSQSVNQIPNLEHYQVMVALAKEAQIAFPTPPTKTVCLVWHIDDPSKVQGSREEVRAAYETTLRFLDEHIRALVGAVLGDEDEREGRG